MGSQKSHHSRTVLTTEPKAARLAVLPTSQSLLTSSAYRRNGGVGISCTKNRCSYDAALTCSRTDSMGSNGVPLMAFGLEIMAAV